MRSETQAKAGAGAHGETVDTGQWAAGTRWLLISL